MRYHGKRRNSYKQSQVQPSASVWRHLVCTVLVGTNNSIGLSAISRLHGRRENVCLAQHTHCQYRYMHPLMPHGLTSRAPGRQHDAVKVSTGLSATKSQKDSGCSRGNHAELCHDSEVLTAIVICLLQYCWFYGRASLAAQLLSPKVPWLSLREVKRGD